MANTRKSLAFELCSDGDSAFGMLFVASKFPLLPALWKLLRQEMAPLAMRPYF